MNPHFTPRLQRGIAVGILVLLVGLVWFGLIGPVWLSWQTRVAQIDQSETAILRLRSIAAETPSLRVQLSKLALSQQDQSLAFSAANANLAATQLQSEVKRIATASGAQIQSIQQLPAVPENGLDRIGIRIEFQSNTAQIAQILRDLEGHSPKLFVHNLSVRGSEQQAVALGQPSPLFVQMEVTAYTGGKG